MVTIIILLVALIALDIAASKWSVNSRDGLNNAKWERKWQWGCAIP